MFVTTVITRLARAVAPDGAPDVYVSSGLCVLEQSGFVDVNADGIDDLILEVGEEIYGFPSSRTSAIVRWIVPGAIGWGHVDMTSSPDGGPAQLYWSQENHDVYFRAEYTIDPSSLALVELWSSSEWSWSYAYVGDIDGDGMADLGGTQAYRLSSTGATLDMPGLFFDASGRRYNIQNVNAIGDINADGFDDVVVEWRTTEYDPYSKCGWTWGPAALFLGSPSGLGTESLWRLWVPGHPDWGLGRDAVAFPEHDALVVSMLGEGVTFCTDWTRLTLGVIRDASTTGAYVDQSIELTELGADGIFSSYILGVLAGPNSESDLAVLDGTGAHQGMQWLGWDDAAGMLADAPVVDWSLSDAAFHSYITQTSSLPGGHRQAISASIGENELAVWGRAPEAISPGGSTTFDDPCNFWAMDFTTFFEDPPHDPPEPGITSVGEDSTPTLPSHRCGCHWTEQVGSLCVWVIGMGAGIRRRRDGARAGASPRSRAA